MIDSGERLRWAGAARARGRQALDGRRRRQDLAARWRRWSPRAALTVPMIAGRALGHTGGTLDKLEAIPGFRTALTPREIGRVLARAGLRARRPDRAPGARRSRALRAARRHRHRRVDPADRVVDPVEEGRRGGARAGDGRQGRQRRVPARRARRRARWRARWSRSGKQLGLPVRALLTDMDQPLGDAIGNAAEVREAIDVLRGGGPADVRALTVRLGAEMLVLGRRRARSRATARAGSRRRSPAAPGSSAFAWASRLQGGDPRAIDDPRRLPRARHARAGARAPGRGVVTRVDAGAARARRDAAGRGPAAQGGPDRAGRGDPAARQGRRRRSRAATALATVEYDDAGRARAARPLIEQAFIDRRHGARAPAPAGARDARLQDASTARTARLDRSTAFALAPRSGARCRSL